MCQPALSMMCNNANPKTMNLPLHLPRMKFPKRSVHFNPVVHVAPFERVSTDEANNVWYSSAEVANMKISGREMAASYRKLGSQHNEGDAYRGFEGFSFQRQRQRLLSNRCAVYAYKQGLDESMMSALYKQCNQWSCDIAFIQAMHDIVGAYEMEFNSNTPECTIPSVTSILPPPDLPFAAKGFLVLQKQRKSRAQRELKRRASTAGIRRVRPRVS